VLSSIDVFGISYLYPSRQLKILQASIQPKDDQFNNFIIIVGMNSTAYCPLFGLTNFLWERIIAMTKGFGFGLIIRRIIGIKGCKQNCVSVIAGMEFAF
jgi:hypothetical protein